MATSQDMVPTGQPYGARKANVAAMQAAGVPLSSEGGAPPAAAASPAPSPAPAGGVRPAPPQPAGAPPPDLGSFDVFANRQPNPNFVSAPPRQVAFQQVRDSQNRVMQEIFSRMDGYKEQG